MTPVNFYRGLDACYNKENHKNGIYFSMDKHVIYHDGKTFGGIDPQYFSGVTKDFDIDGNTVSFKKLNENGNWDTVSIELVKAADKSIEIGTITNTEGTVNDGFTVKVKAQYATDGDGLKLGDNGLYVDLHRQITQLQQIRQTLQQIRMLLMQIRLPLIQIRLPLIH